MPDRLHTRPPALALFAKAARPGRVKTRLGPVLAPPAAAEFHGLCAVSLWRRFAADPRFDAYLYCDIGWAPFEAVAGPARFRLQRGLDLGARMLNCLRDLLAAGHRKALIVGSDAPTLPDAQVEEVLSSLDGRDVVLGPSRDGGFTLIGAARTSPAMFDGVAWSRADTLEATLRAIAGAGLGAAVTATPAYDVDTPADLERLAADPDLPRALGAWFRRRAGRDL